MPKERRMPRDEGQNGTPQGVFGAELRYYRERGGLSQTELAALVSVSHDVISKIETGDRPPAKDFPERLDAVPELDTRGGLARIWGNLSKGLRNRAIPGWFRPWADIEAEAAVLRTYQPLLVPGLLQTGDYARAVLRGAQADATDDQIEQQVAVRLGRQEILARENPPRLWAVLDEGVLHRAISESKVMHDQLLRVAEVSEWPRMSIQVIPFVAGARTGLLGAFVIANLDTDGGTLYFETATTGQVVEIPSAIREAGLTFDNLRGEALPRTASRDLIMKVAQERWT
jgi:transcriptional regulator with XRE-family HTH domain